MLETTLLELASLFREHGIDVQADGLEAMARSDPDALPRRVLDLFGHGMGGIFDPPLYRDGELDHEADERRRQLAERLSAEARERLS